MSQETGDKLSKNDLYILMESYKNNIQLNTTLLEQQKQLIVMINQSVDKQKVLCENLDQFIQNLTTCSTKLEENHSKLIGLIESKTNSIGNQLTVTSSINSVEHEKITNKIYAAWGGMVLIVISLITLAVTFADKYHDILKLIGKG
jgi:drug/metabolite transporter superfamily protein YnfA